ncbi:DUF6117 family protein [Sphingobium scionense]
MPSARRIRLRPRRSLRRSGVGCVGRRNVGELPSSCRGGATRCPRFLWERMMAIPDHHRANFQTLLDAAMDGNLALMECVDAVSGEPRFVVCAVYRSGEEYLFTPFGHLHDGDPFAAYVPPAP